jgi:hypothetical protein
MDSRDFSVAIRVLDLRSSVLDSMLGNIREMDQLRLTEQSLAEAESRLAGKASTSG